jgi:DNA-binding MarR family transcriptional regulator
MLNAPPRVPMLTRAQKKVLADLDLFSDGKAQVVISSRQLAETTGLSRPTVLSALEQLNELQLIQTLRGGPRRASLHRLLPVRSVRTASGQIGGRS